jgi:TadE-like protein
MWPALLTRLAEFRRNRRGVAAVEMAIVTPFMLLLAFGGTDFTRYVIATEKMSRIANTIGQMLTQNSLGYVNDLDLQFYHDSAMVVYPDLLTDAAARGTPWSTDIAITMSSIQFTANPAGCAPAACTYVPSVVWSSGPNPRKCASKFSSVADASVPLTTTLPKDVYGPGSIVVVDIQYNYHPLFPIYFGNPLGISRSVYFAPRYVSLVGYKTGGANGALATQC